MQSEHLNCKSKGGQSNGVINEIDEMRAGISNGYSNIDESIQNGGCGKHSERKRKTDRKMTTMEKDIISLIGQHLREKGYSKTLDSLMEESGCALEHPKAGCFRRHILLGEWKEGLEALNELSKLLGDPYSTEKMRLLLLEEKFLEHLEEGEKLQALQCLRHDLVALPLHHPEKRIQDLSQYLMCETREELYRLSNWPGVEGGARQRLLDQLQAFLPPSVMLPPKRLELLLRQSVQLQVDKCPFHYTEKDISCYSLLTDHICPRSHFPSETVHTLKAHNEEVWFVQFSHHGSQLASGSKDGNIIIWNVQPSEAPKRFLTLKGQSSGVASLSWSADDTLLLSLGAEDCPEVIVFNAKTGEEKCRVSNSPEDSLTCGCWHRLGRKFYVGGSRGQFYECSTESGSVTSSWEGIRLHAVAAHPYNNSVFAADSHKRIRQYNFEDRSSSTLIKEDHAIMSFTLSRDARYALLNVANQGVHMWDLSDRCIVRRYQGVTQGFYTIHSCFGVSDSFIASGSEDHHMYIWNRKRETPVIVLQGHTRTVNCVCWNSAHYSMIASASDDCTIRVWGTDKEMKYQREVERLKTEENEEKKKREVNQNGSGEGGGGADEGEEEEEDDNEEDSEDNDGMDMQEQPPYEQLSRPISELDLQALEMLDPDSSSQEENSNDRLEAAVSLSSLSVGLQRADITLNTQNTSRVLSSSSSRGIGMGPGMLVIMSTQGFRDRGDELETEEQEDDDSVAQRSLSLPPMLSQPSLEQESRSFDLDSSMESEESRHLESFQSVLSEADPSSDRSVTVITSAARSTRQEREEGGEQEQQRGSGPASSADRPSLAASVDSTNNGSSTTSSRGRLRETDESATPSITTESSISTVV